ncbi:hypothetical protein MUO69_04935 [Candidatus Bathyarchaeota archaeon]|nr:hypothetical protein [Candidatus Bathyarchaeota archaeon]
MSSNSGNFMRMLVLAVLIVVAFLLFSRMFSSPPPNVQVNDCSLSSDAVQSGGQTSISVALQSNDASNAHLIRTEISSHYLVMFLIGSQELQKNGTIWYYEQTLESKGAHTNVINVRPTLESGVSRITYRINIVIYMDGQQIFSKNLDLVVQLP